MSEDVVEHIMGGYSWGGLHACHGAAWSLQVFIIRCRRLCLCSPCSVVPPLNKRKAAPLVNLVSPLCLCGSTICHDAIFLWPAKLPMWQERCVCMCVCVNDGLWDAASFASLTNWGKSWSCMVKKRKERKTEQEWRRVLGENANGQQRCSRFARGHDLHHLLFLIDQRKKGEEVMVCGLTREWSDGTEGGG